MLAEMKIYGLPKEYSVVIKRLPPDTSTTTVTPLPDTATIMSWPGENKKLCGLDLADLEEKIAVLTALTKIWQFSFEVNEFMIVT
ncbi:hypothetical protein F8M41_021842 [Gigaspora margarita]|uniref:Uncharacterized protein n=1 Tax=Gigaspora margarita TaxID=4874 RepID=A0A8H4EIQ1_GIGMA|nr:hypothetical protein F8M41_021842 [Gigaspora margarita]